MFGKKREKSPTTGRFVKRGTLAKLAEMFSKKDPPAMIEHDADQAEHGTSRTKR